ncbi:S-layer homology domain-containing protein [Bacillus sp. ISL-45]|uniref:S-layer homology domain-containing protein n=1 Tax=Bacillus sp. ISL-45 TaxID=2819128 RepID=UPI001BE9841B|nr:S-layer homology domain-containing protein [Bacillus sp. ISL-45]MBT2661588.1 S-layer homology domain-containing protein [Bacillus sp. ISL-45]
MKKYPFSNKAIKAIIAASIALSPLASTGTILQQTTVSAAEVTTVDTAVQRVTLIYSNLGEQELFKTVAESLKNDFTFTSEDWTYVLTQPVRTQMQASMDAAGADVVAEQVVKEIAAFVYDSNATNLATNYAAFKASASGQAITKVMGAGKIDLMLQLLVDTEKLLWSEKYEDKLLTALENGTLETVIDEIRAEVIASNPAYEQLNKDLAAKMGTNFEGLLQIKNRINEKLVAKGIITSTDLETLKDAFLIAALKAGNPNDGGSTPPPGGGGGGTLPPTNPDPNVISLPKDAAEVVREKNPSGMVEVVTKIVPEKVADIVALITGEKNTVEVVLEAAAPGEKAKAEVPAALFTEAAKKNPNAVIEISTAEASYKLPASEIKIADLAAKLGTTADNVKINISVNVVNKTVKGLTLASDVIDFTIEAVAGTRKEYISTFSSYVEREIMGDTDFNKGKSVAVRLNADGTFSAIPTLFDGKTATIKSLTNSEYTIVENSKTFTDVKSGWAKEYIDTLASKYIVYGKATGEYEPGKHMTRAEFAVLLVRALGLPTAKYDGSFKDVKGIEWFAKNGELTAAVKYGVIKGKGDGTFAPNEKITRAQAAAMIERAMKISFVKYDFSQLDKTKTLNDFKDAKQVGSWAKSGVEAVYQAGIVKGKGDGTFNPNGYTQRNEMAAILANFLVTAKLLDDTFK